MIAVIRPIDTYLEIGTATRDPVVLYKCSACKCYVSLREVECFHCKAELC